MDFRRPPGGATSRSHLLSSTFNATGFFQYPPSGARDPSPLPLCGPGGADGSGGGSWPRPAAGLSYHLNPTTLAMLQQHNYVPDSRGTGDACPPAPVETEPHPSPPPGDGVWSWSRAEQRGGGPVCAGLGPGSSRPECCGAAAGPSRPSMSHLTARLTSQLRTEQEPASVTLVTSFPLNPLTVEREPPP